MLQFCFIPLIPYLLVFSKTSTFLRSSLFSFEQFSTLEIEERKMDIKKNQSFIQDILKQNKFAFTESSVILPAFTKSYTNWL